MNDLNIFVKEPNWHKLLEAVSRILGMPGLDKSDESGRRHVWHLVGLEIIALEKPDLEDDNGILFSTFASEVDLTLCETDYLNEAEAFRHAFAVLLVLRLRSLLDSNTCLVRNLQQEIIV
jgi:hypothetical protein